MPGVEIKIADDGEVLVRGANVFMGYWNSPAATRTALEGGWLHTGDLGRIEADGNLYLLGRTSSCFKLRNGEFINPEPIEQMLRTGMIGEVVVVGRDQRCLGAAIILDSEVKRALAKEHGVEDETVSRLASVRALIQQTVDAANTKLVGDNKVRAFFVVDRPLRTGADGEIGPTGKLKRPVFERAFATEIAAMFA